MENFSIRTRITEKEYSKIMYIGLYRKPVFIAACILGVYYFVTVILDRLKIITYYSSTPYLEIFLCLFLLLLPTLIVLASLRQLRSNPSFQHEITYTIGENGITIQGLTFKGEFQWAHVIKRKEINKFLILYHSKRMGNFIDKTKLTAEQLQFIKSKVKGR
ncbi:YcxB family protein [Puia dinghuensis]|uniref:YcxB family protein n=1 Tax=Puia dinghuensis TaxID=1792502 RepID=UPI00166D3ED9|nr:YcxB family protein [Puia dinghuensis]